MKVVIPSKMRVNTLLKYGLKLFPEAIVCVAENERDAYHTALKAIGKEKQLLLHPDPGSLPKIFNWILDNVDDPHFAMTADDAERIHSLVGWKPRIIRNPDDVMQLLENCCEIAYGFGSELFGFRQSGNPLQFLPQQPLSLNHWVGGLFGVIGREMRFDEVLLYNEDVDLSLDSMMRKRVVYMDGRFFLYGAGEKNAGGLSTVRSPENTRRNMDHLEAKWGRYLTVKWDKKSTYRLQTHVTRRQSLITAV